MLSSRSSKDDDRNKMKEEAKKRRAMIARSANLPHTSRNDFRGGDLGFKTRKVVPNVDDDFSVVLKDRLIDYHELLGTFGTREDYRYLGIDNVPGTPEVNIANFDESFIFTRPVPRVNGFRHVKEEPSILKNDLVKNTSNAVTAAPSSPPKQSNLAIIKDEPLSPLKNCTPTDKTATQSIGDVGNKARNVQARTKPPDLTMPSKSIANDSDKTQKAHPSKIESILKEMTDVLPPLTDIHTPVKSKDTRFPFPLPSASKENVNSNPISGEQCVHGKTDEILKTDLITTSDDESDDDIEQNHISKADAVLGATKRRLSASSSSSSDGGSSDSSSESDSSDTENEDKDSACRKAVKRPSNAINTPMNPTATSAINGSLLSNQSIRYNDFEINGKAKLVRGEELEKQVSPLNSLHKEIRKEAEISLMPVEPLRMSNLNQRTQESPHKVTTDIDRNLDSAVCSRPMESMPNGLRTDSNMHVYEPLDDPCEDLIFDKTDDLIPTSLDSEVLADMICPVRFPQLEEPEDSATSTVNLDSLNLTPSSGFNTSKVFNDERVDGGKKMAKISQPATESEDIETFSSGRKNSSSTPIQNRLQSKKDKEHEWFMKILSPTKKSFDLPYVNPDKLRIGIAKELPTSKAPNIPLKVQIPLSKLKHPGKKVPQLTNSKPAKKKKSSERDAAKNRTVLVNRSEKPRQSVGKDIEQIKSLMRELSNKASEDEETLDIISTPSPLKPTPKPERISGKNMRGTPVSYVAKKEPQAGGALATSESTDLTAAQEKTEEARKKKSEPQKGVSRKRTSSSLSQTDSDNLSVRVKNSKKHKRMKNSMKGSSVNRQVIEHSEDSNAGFKTPNSVVSNHNTIDNKLLVSINLSKLKRVPGNNEPEEDEEVTEAKSDVREEEFKGESTTEVNSIAGPVWKPVPKIKIPKLTKPPEDEMSQKASKVCSENSHDCLDTDTSSNCSSTYKPPKDGMKSRKNRPLMDGRGVKRKEWERNSKNVNTNVCGMCGSLQKDSGRDPIRLGAYKTSYVEYLNMGKRSKHIADCLDASERAPKYIDAVLKYIQYLVGLEITGKTGTKNGFEEYMCITSQCIDLVDFVVNQYGKKENNNNANYDSRFVSLCLRLQSVLYFKLYGAKKDSAARYSKLLSEYFKIHRSPHRVNIKGSTGTPSPMSPTSSHTGSVASFGSSASNGSYEKMLNVGSVVSIPTETFERMQQYFTYTKYLLHGHRLWDDADSISSQCQEFINIVSRRVGAITIQSSMLHLVDYISFGLQVIKDSEN